MSCALVTILSNKEYSFSLMSSNLLIGSPKHEDARGLVFPRESRLSADQRTNKSFQVLVEDRAPHSCASQNFKITRPIVEETMPDESVRSEKISVFDRDVHCVLGLPFDALDRHQAASIVVSATKTKRPVHLVTPNVNFLVSAIGDQEFRKNALAADLSCADGWPVISVSKLLGIPILNRAAGSTLFEMLSDQNPVGSVKVFFFGGDEGVAELAHSRTNQKRSGVESVGFQNPGFVSAGEMSTEEIRASINSANPDFLIVSLGAKKGLEWIQRNKAHITAPVVSHLGAVVNFAAGTIRRCPEFIQNLNGEWLWRAVAEPRLVKRYLSDGLAFLGLLVTRVVPMLISQRRGADSAEFKQPTAIVTEMVDDCYRIKFEGNLSARCGSPIRAAFETAVRKGRPVEIDLTNVSEVGSSFTGLLLLLSSALDQQQLSLRLMKVNQHVRGQFRYHCVDWLLA